MGLDMYLYKIESDHAGDAQVDFVADYVGMEIAYWRKFNHLHGWMQRLYEAKGGKSDYGFNGEWLRLDPEDLDTLERDLDNPEETMPATSGFFFGSPTLYPESIEATRKAIDRARTAIDDGYVVAYRCSW